MRRGQRKNDINKNRTFLINYIIPLIYLRLCCSFHLMIFNRWIFFFDEPKYCSNLTAYWYIFELASDCYWRGQNADEFQVEIGEEVVTSGYAKKAEKTVGKDSVFIYEIKKLFFEWKCSVSLMKFLKGNGLKSFVTISHK